MPGLLRSSKNAFVPGARIQRKQGWLRTDQMKARHSSGVYTEMEHYSRMPAPPGHRTRADGVRPEG